MEKLIFPVTKKEAGKVGTSYSSEANKNALFPSQLRKLRKEKGVSQETVARDLGVSKSTIGLYETGDTLPDAKTLCDLAKYYEVSADYLVGITAAKTSDPNIKLVLEKIGITEKAFDALTNLKSSISQISSQESAEFEETVSEIYECAASIENDAKIHNRNFDKSEYIEQRIMEEREQMMHPKSFSVELVLDALNVLIENEEELGFFKNIALFLWTTQRQEKKNFNILVGSKEKEGYYAHESGFAEADLVQMFLLNIQHTLVNLRSKEQPKYFIDDIWTSDK